MDAHAGSRQRQCHGPGGFPHVFGRGATITNITGYSDGPALDELGAQSGCSYHATFTYTTTKDKTLTGALASAALYYGTFDSFDLVGSAGPTPVDTASLFNPGTLFGSTNPATVAPYAFLVGIESSKGDLMAMRYSAPFTLDPATYVDGCPPAGQLVSTNFSG